MKKIKVLCVCAVGLNRSRYLANYLKRKGYLTRYGGVEYREEGDFNPLKKEDAAWADIIIIVRKRLEPTFKKKFDYKNKKIIVLDVTDSKKRILERIPHLWDQNYEELQRKWTRPQLRKAIKKYLPLNLGKRIK